MDCHGDNKGKNNSHNHSPLKHMLHMAICCGLPVVLLAMLPFIARVSPGAGRLVAVIAPFLCPLMMLSMIPMMLGGNKKEECHENENKIHQDKKILELNKPTE